MVTKLAKKPAAADAAADVGAAAKISRSMGAIRQVALVTGASSGIGEALAHCFADAGHDVILVARSADKLRALAIELKSRHGVKAHVAGLASPLTGTMQAWPSKP